MSISKQKIIRFIPLLNVVTVFFWFKSLKYAENKIKNVIKTLSFIYASLLAITIARIVLIKLVENDVVMVFGTIACIYCYFFAISFFTVRAQEMITYS